MGAQQAGSGPRVDASSEGGTDGPRITLRVNGEERQVAAGTTVTGLLEGLGLVPALVVVERNREILDRSEYPERVLEEGDHLELVHFVGGG